MEHTEYFNTMHFAIKKSIVDGTLDKRAIHNYVLHIPFKEKQKGWPEEVYSAGLPLLEDLYSYSKREKYVRDGLSIREFITEAMQWK